MNQKQPDEFYEVEKVVETMKVLEVLDFEPVSIQRVIDRVGLLPNKNKKKASENFRKLKPDAAMRILKTLKILGYAHEDENKAWIRGYKRL
jgi:hypothetical protein